MEVAAKCEGRELELFLQGELDHHGAKGLLQRLDREIETALPLRLTNVVFCKNPRCITTTEQELPHVFRLTDPENRVYRCLYCDAKAQ